MMGDPMPREWEKLLEGQSLLRIIRFEPPAHLSEDEWVAFSNARFAWFDERFAKLKATAKQSNIGEQRSRLLGLLAARTEQLAKSPPMEESKEVAHLGDGKSVAEQCVLLPRAGPLVPPMVIPKGSSDELLERQIATASGLIEHLAYYVARADTDPGVCMGFVARMAALMKSSAENGAVVGKLRGLASAETRHRVIISRQD